MSTAPAYAQMLVALTCLVLVPLGALIRLPRGWETWTARVGWMIFFAGAGVGSLYGVYFVFNSDNSGGLPLYYEVALVAQAVGVVTLAFSISPYFHDLSKVFRDDSATKTGREKDQDA
jgi:4-amino-4-deoxy-L-arabinose transferase-like glycosyltransferase